MGRRSVRDLLTIGAIVVGGWAAVAAQAPRDESLRQLFESQAAQVTIDFPAMSLTAR